MTEHSVPYPDEVETILCLSTYVKGQVYLQKLARLGCRVILLTLDKHRDDDWPRESLSELITMPSGLTLEQVTNTVCYLARSRKLDRIVALDEFDMETAAALREHMRIPGMGQTTTRNFRDKLAMRTKAKQLGIRVPEFVAVINYDELRAYMANIPGPWVLKPRAEASAIGIRKIHIAEQLWRSLDELGDRQSHYVLERFVPGDIYHVDGITSEREVVFAAVHKYGKPPMQVMHEGGVFTTRSVERGTEEDTSLQEIHAKLIPGMGMVRGVTHTEFIRAHADGEYYFLETAARVGGAFIAEVVEYSRGVNPWAEWARIEVMALRGEKYELPELRDEYAGSVICLAKVERPDTSQFEAPEIVLRMQKHHHAGLIVRSKDPNRITELTEEYARRFAEQFLATAPVPDRPTA